MPALHSNTVVENPFETSFIEVSDPLYLILIEAQKSLGFESMSDLIKDMLTASKARDWLEYPDLLPVCEKNDMTYDAMMKHIQEH